MNCNGCKRPIRGGTEAAKRIETREIDGTEVQFGIGMPAGPLTQARGRLVRAEHGKCFHAGQNRVERGGDRALGAAGLSAFGGDV